MDGDCYIEMPRYKCHKEVWALKIKRIEHHNEGDPTAETDGSALLHFENTRYAPIHVDRPFMLKHAPTAGGYYVAYKDGYRSFSPASSFEDGYTLIENKE